MRFLPLVLLGFVLAGLAGGGCASESQLNLPFGVDAGRDGSGLGQLPAATVGSCNPAYCPNKNGAGTGCCLTPNGPCGVDLGMGCMANPRDGG